MPSDAVIFRHSVVFSPQSTVFTHSLIATYIDTAGYEVNYAGDPYAWRVYVNPYTGLENTASLVSNISIILPYSNMLIEKIELYAKTNGTGNYRQLWIKLLNNTGGVVFEVLNVTMNIDWEYIVIIVNKTISNNVIIWVNATITSTTDIGEELCITGVKLHVTYNSTTFSYTLPALVDYFNVTTLFTVNLTNTALNSSIIDFLIIDKLTYNTTNYPVKPVYFRNESINGVNYMVYRVINATSTGLYYLYTLIPNSINIKFKSRGVDVSRVIVGEPFTIEIPVTGNISIYPLKLEYLNTSTVTITITTPGVYLVRANSTRTREYIIGLREAVIIVDYGFITLRFKDLDDSLVDYEILDLLVVNKYTGELRGFKGKISVNISNLTYGVYEFNVKIKGVTLCVSSLDLYVLTNASTIDLSCKLKRIIDYRGVNKSIIHDVDKQLILLEDLSFKYPYSRMRILLSGSGVYTLILNYYGKKPTNVLITSNTTISRWYWDGDYLVITGVLGGISEINITDLYRLKLEVYDRLGNILTHLPPLIMINETTHISPVVDVFVYPETYNITLPFNINGFLFYGFSDRYNETTRLINISVSDLLLRAYYRVPTKITTSVFQVKSLFEIMRRVLGLAGGEEYVTVYFEGKLLDYYDNGVSNRPITIRLYRENTVISEFNLTTDITGYWKTPIIQLLRGEKYSLIIIYPGDDVYVGSVLTTEFTSEALPITPTPVVISPLEVLLVIIGVLVVVSLILAVTRALKHTIIEVISEKRRFIRKKN